VRTLSAAILAAVVLSGCGLFQAYQAPVSTKAPVVCEAFTGDAASVCAQAGDILVKGYITVAAIDQDIKKTAPTGIWTKAQAQDYLDQAKEARKKLDAAWDVYATGNYQAALDQANVTDTLITALEKKIAADAAKGKTQ
jgi:hypothetical protein